MRDKKQKSQRTIDNRHAEQPLPVPSAPVGSAHRQGDTPVVHDRALTAHELSILSGLSVGHLARLYVPTRKEATHPRCAFEGCPDWPGRASHKEGESWDIIAKLSSGSIPRS